MEELKKMGRSSIIALCAEIVYIAIVAVVFFLATAGIVQLGASGTLLFIGLTAFSVMLLVHSIWDWFFSHLDQKVQFRLSYDLLRLIEEARDRHFGTILPGWRAFNPFVELEFFTRIQTSASRLSEVSLSANQAKSFTRIVQEALDEIKDLSRISETTAVESKIVELENMLA